MNSQLSLIPQASESTPELLDTALQLANRCKTSILNRINNTLSVERKADRSFVTDLDRFVENEFREHLVKVHPQGGVIGEEFGYSDRTAEYQWVIDPIDGTAELVAGVPVFGTVIGLLYRGYPIIGIIDLPMMNLRVHAARGLGCFRNDARVEKLRHQNSNARLHLPPAEAFFRRVSNIPSWYITLMTRYPATRSYFTCLSLAAAATGGVDASLEYDLRIWDFAAAPVLVEEAGGAFEIFSRKLDDECEERFSFVLGEKTMCEDIRRTVTETVL